MIILLIAASTLSFEVASITVNRALLAFLGHIVAKISHWTSIQAQIISS